MTPATRIAVPLAAILDRAAQQPEAEAFRQRRRGAWVPWTLGDLAARSAGLGGALAAARPRPKLVAVSGDYGPALVLVALAAAQAGAELVALPPAVPQAALAAWLAQARPDAAFVGQRDQVGIWRAALREAATGTTLLADIHLPWGEPRHAGVLSLGESLGAPPAGQATLPDPVVWIEEGTEWAEGLAFILQNAARGGPVLAFPETRMAAARDRVVAQPAGFTLSAPHYRVVQDDFRARLPLGRGPAARAIDAALAGGRPGPIGRWLLARLRRPLGLSRLRAVTVVGGQPAAGDDLFAALGIAAAHEAPDWAPAAALAFA